MKPILIFIAAITLITGGCKKKGTDTPTTPNQQVTMKTFDKKTFELTVNTRQGPVTLQMEDLPIHVKSGALNPVAGNTPFNTNVSLSSQHAAAGNYTIKLAAYTEGQTDSFRITPVDLTIEPFSSSECNEFFNALANGVNSSTFVQDEAGTRGFKEQPTIIFNQGQLALKNLVVYYLITSNFTVSKASAADQSIPFTIACEEGKLTIPATTVTDVDGKSYTVSGSGIINYETQSYVITYTSDGLTMLMKGSIDYDAYFTP